MNRIRIFALVLAMAALSVVATGVFVVAAPTAAVAGCSNRC